MCKKLRFVNVVVTTVVCFGTGPQAVHMSDFAKLNVHFRKVARTVVGPPVGVDWAQPLHQIFHLWNERVVAFMIQSGIRPWGEVALQQQWKFAMYIANLPGNSWAKRILNWNPPRKGTVGRPRFTWHSKLEDFCRCKQLDPCTLLAAD